MNWLGENVERWNAKWVALVMCWEVEVEVDWLVDTLRDVRFSGLACCFGERQTVKWIGLLIRREVEDEVDWLEDAVRDGR
jgi:hypothetical protein